MHSVEWLPRWHFILKAGSTWQKAVQTAPGRLFCEPESLSFSLTHGDKRVADVPSYPVLVVLFSSVKCIRCCGTSVQNFFLFQN